MWSEHVSRLVPSAAPAAPRVLIFTSRFGFTESRWIRRPTCNADGRRTISRRTRQVDRDWVADEHARGVAVAGLDPKRPAPPCESKPPSGDRPHHTFRCRATDLPL